MALQSEERIVVAHAVSVVTDPYEFPAPELDIDLNGACVRVDGVFNQFFDHRDRALDHFARGYPVDHGFIQDSDRSAHLGR